MRSGRRGSRKKKVLNAITQQIVLFVKVTADVGAHDHLLTDRFDN